MAKFLDVLLSSIGIFFLAFCWVYYVLKEVTVALLLALLLTICCAYVIFRVVTTRESKLNAKTQSKDRLTALSCYLCFCNHLEELFGNLLQYYRFTLIDIDLLAEGLLLAEKNGQKSLIALCFEEDTTSKLQVRRAVIYAKKLQVDKVILFCNGATTEIKQMANQQILTQFVDIQNTYALFEQADRLPPLKKVKNKKSAYFGQYAFSKKRFGWYLTGSIFMLITSALTFFPLYSIIWATIMLILALYSLLNKKYNTIPTNVTLE